MCYEDVKLGRATKGRIWTTNGTLTIPANGKRIGFWLSASIPDIAVLEANVNGTTVILAYAANFATGTAENTSNGPVYIDIRQWGDLIFGEFTLRSVSSVRATVIETYLDDGPGWKP
jgi:hypothetical protein